MGIKIGDGWIFNDMYKKSQKPNQFGIATASFESPYSSISADDVLLWDASTTVHVGCDNGENKASLLITFSEIITITHYRLQQNANKRFLTKWKLEGAISPHAFKTIDTRDENLCNDITRCECSKLTEKTYNLTVPRTKLKFARLTLEKDSCNTYYMHLGAIDFKIVQTNKCTQMKSIYRNNNLYSILLYCLFVCV